MQTLQLHVADTLWNTSFDCAWITSRQTFQTAHTWKIDTLHSSFIKFTLFICVFGWGRAYAYHGMHVEVREWLILLCFHPMTFRNQTQAFRLSGKDLNPPSPLTGPCTICFLKPTDTKSRVLKITSYLHSSYTNTLTTWEFKRNLGGSFQCFPIVTIHTVH